MTRIGPRTVPGKPRWPFRRLGAFELYWPGMITVWHVEPGGRDSGEVCRHYVRTRQPDGTYATRFLRGWRWHVRHWRVQVHALQALRRWLLTRCAWCGGASRRGDAVNYSHSWGGPRGRWWQGEPGLYHSACSSIYSAHQTCLCAVPALDHGNYGRCAVCTKRRGYGASPEWLQQARVLARIPVGGRG